MRTTLHGTLPLSPLLSDTAQSAYVTDALKTGTLISLAQLCDDGCLAVFSNKDVKIHKKDSVIITGTRLTNGLWSIPLHVPPSPSAMQHLANGILRLDKPKQELAMYHHAALGSPAVSTLLRAISRGHLTTFPGLTTSLITKHLPKSIATVMGHQDQEARHLRSTATLPAIPLADVDLDLAPPLDSRSHQVCAMLIPKQTILRSYSDQTGLFPVPSSRGNHYLFILYHQDTNTIHAVAIPSRKGPSIRDAWLATHTALVHQGHAPTLHILDNECTQDLKNAFLSQRIAFQRVPPHEHRVNAAERAIRTFKNHFIATLCTIDSKFPLTEWDRLLPQTVLTLNLLRSSRIHPSLSAHASLYGNFDFNKTPIAPVGTRVVAHLTPDQRTTFAPHGKLGWYIGPSLEHYRCYKCYFEDTHRERDLLKVDFFPQKFPFPSFSADAYLKQTAEDMLHLLKNKQDPRDSSVHNPLSFGPPVLNAYRHIAELLGRALSPLPTPPSPSYDVLPPLPLPADTPVRPTPHIVPPPRVSDATMRPLGSTTLPLPPPRVPIPPPRVPIQPPIHPFPLAVPPLKLPASHASSVPKHSPLHAVLRRSPRARLSSLHFDPRTHRRHLVQSVQVSAVSHDPTIAGKMYDPVTGKAETIDSLLKGPDSARWTRSLANEWGRCTQGLLKRAVVSERIKGNNTMFFILPFQVPHDRKVTYAQFVCTMRPGKAEEWRVRMTVGGNLLDAYQDVRSPAVSLLDAKIHFNSVISDASRGARYCTCDLKDFFLQSMMKIFQYMKIHRRYIPDEIIEEYSLTPAHFDSKGYLYVEIRKGMYGLKEAAILAYEQLRDHLAPYGYSPVAHTPGLWRHATRPTTFTLAVDDFGIKYFSKPDAQHLFDALSNRYELTIDWTGASYCGFTLDWHYDAGFVDLSMPNYVPKALLTLRHPPPFKPQHSPHLWSAPTYGQTVQLAPSDLSPLLDKAGIHRVQQISGLFLYYSRGCDPTIIVALNEISNQQAAPTEKTRAACNMLLDYLSTHPLATIRYHASDMVLAVCSDAAYLVLPNARSRAAGHFYLTTLASATSNPPAPVKNGPLHVLCKTLRTVAASAAEAEVGSLFLNAQEAVPIITTLTEMGHPQPPSGVPLETDNSTAHGILTAQVRLKRSKAFDMRWWWLRDRCDQKQFNIFWQRGATNSADYFSKHHPPAHHRRMRDAYLHPTRPSLSALFTSAVRGCVSPSWFPPWWHPSGFLIPPLTLPQ
jgi:hypothetical protein